MKAFSKSLVESSKAGILRDSREANLPAFDTGIMNGGRKGIVGVGARY
jgi:hypothetical protein